MSDQETIQKLSTALRNADKAGAADDARKLARALQAATQAMKARSQQQPKAEPEDDRGFLGAVDDRMRVVADGITLGSADEIAAGLNAVGALFTDEDFSDAFDRNVKAERDATEAAKGRLGGVESTVLGAGGAIAGTLGVGNALRLPSIIKNGAGMGVNALRVGGAGAGLGGVQAFNSAEGGVANRLNDVPRAALVGAGFGLAGAGAGSLAASGIGAGRNMLARMMGASNSADDAATRAFADTAAREGFTSPGQVRNKLLELGDQAAPVDLGRNFQRAARGARVASAEADDTLNRFFVTRQEGDLGLGGQGDRIIRQVENTISRETDSLSETGRLIAQRQRDAGRLYEQARTVMVPVGDDLARVLGTPAGRKALREARTKIGNERNVVGPPVVQNPDGSMEMSTQFLDLVKRRLDQSVKVAQRSGANDDVRQLSDLVGRLRNEVDSVNPMYAQARAAYAEPSKLADATELGTKFLKEDVRVTSQQLANMTPEEQLYFRVGAADALVSKVKGTNTNADATREFLGKVSTREKLEAIFPDQRQRDQFVKFLQAERTKSQTRNAVGGGSPTADKIEDRNLVQILLGGGGLLGSAAKVGQSTVRTLTSRGTRERANALSRALTDTDADAVFGRLQGEIARANRRAALQRRAGNALVVSGATLAD